MVKGINIYNNIILNTLESLKFVKSFNDFNLYFQKLVYQLSKKTGIIHSLKKVPLSLQIEPTNICNINCLCCPNIISTRKKGYMNLDLFKKIIENAYQIGVKKIYLFGLGEPLLHPKIIEMIHFIKLKGLGIHIATNGMPLNNKKIEKILNTGLNSGDLLKFSILGYSKDIHEFIMKGINHDIVLNNIFEFLKLRKKLNLNGPVIKVGFINLPQNEHEKEQYIKFWRNKVDKVSAYDGKIIFSKKSETIFLNNNRKKTCVNLWERMTIFWNGDVTVCAADWNGKYILGNLKDQTIEEIWYNKEMISIKKAHMNKDFEKLPICSQCDF